MRAHPARHPQGPSVPPKTMPMPPLMRPREGGRGIGVPADPLTGRGVVPVGGAYDRYETRTYNGVAAGLLSEHAKDIYATYNDLPRREGAASRWQARTHAVIQTALWAYIVVKNALALLATPLRGVSRYRPNYGSRQTRAPRAPTVWVTKPPTQAEWAARDASVGYDIRGTSPIWVRRRVYQHRARRRRELEPPLERAYRLGQVRAKQAENASESCAEFIGPPTPRHYVDAPDLHMIWPPVELPREPQGRLPQISEAGLIKADFVETGGRELMAPETMEHVDGLIEGYNFALEQFGEEATFNYLRNLSDRDARVMDAYISIHRAHMRQANDRAPP